MLRNNADARRCSYFDLGLPVIVLHSLPNFLVYITPSYMMPALLRAPYSIEFYVLTLEFL